MTATQLRLARTSLKLTQDQLAILLGVHRVTITRWESGAMEIDHPRMLRLALLALRAGLDS